MADHSLPETDHETARDVTSRGAGVPRAPRERVATAP
jgi:hypothetical protein